jgi:geranylgeranyl pyrophosphate synthase
MKDISIDLVDTLAHIRHRAVVMAEAGWPELGKMVNSILPDPLNPMALLPIATGIAAGGETGRLIPAAAVLTLIDLSLRTVDDCIDRDDQDALYRSIGINRAVNLAMALNTIATRELKHLHLPHHESDGLLDSYFRAFLGICQGQDKDTSVYADTLAEYEEIVRLKTVAAYEFAAVIGARVASPDANAIATCSKCGFHLGWMAQIMNDIEGLWFSIDPSDLSFRPFTFPLLYGLSMENSHTAELHQLCSVDKYDIDRIRILLDKMNVRRELITLALDHRDHALESLGPPLHPDGLAIVQIWLDWLFRDGDYFLGKDSCQNT